MKKIKQILLFSLGLLLALGACQPDEYTLGDVMSKSDLKYSITQNADDPNMIILESLTPGLTPLWVTPLGRSTRVKDTVKLAFAGDYSFTYGVQSNGGYVVADTFKVVVVDNNLEYVKDPLWTLLTGGVGSQKTWYLDLNAEAVSKGFIGPLFFYGTNDSWLSVTDGVAVGGDSWNWNPDYPGNSWLMAAGDYGSMTFSLQGSASVSVDHKMLGVSEVGTYFFDADNKTLSMTDARPLHNIERDGHVVDWGDIKVLSLTADKMQLAVVRDPALSGEGACLLVYNFISKDYSDNWLPAETVDPTPDLGIGDMTSSDLLAVSKTKIWSLSPESPFDWADLNGAMLNGWAAPGDYADWTGYNDSYAASVAACQLHFSADGKIKAIDGDGVETEGTYVINEKTNIITFTGITPSFKMGSWAVATTTAENQWRILKTKSEFNSVTEIWFGQRAEGKAEYFAFHFVLGTGDVTVDPVAVMTKHLTNGATQVWKMDTKVPFSWARNETHDLDYSDVVPDWTGYTDTTVISDVRLSISKDGTASFTNDGVTSNGTFSLDMEKEFITFSSDIVVDFEICGGWVRCGLTEGNYWELYKMEYDDNAKLVGIWFGKQTDLTSGAAGERMVYHFIKE